MRSYFDGLLRYFEFSGRSTRMQYWMFAVFSALVGIAAILADVWFSGIPIEAAVWGPIGIFAALVHAIPGVTVTVRRLHDIGRSGWWYFITFIPLIGAIILLVWMCWPSDEYENAYGAPADTGADRPSAPRQRSYSTIPRDIRMGNAAARTPSIGRGGLSQPDRFI